MAAGFVELAPHIAHLSAEVWATYMVSVALMLASKENYRSGTCVCMDTSV